MSKILVVEDNDLNLKLFCDLLSMKGHKVFVAQEGERVYDIVTQERPDLILMDIQLKGSISGLDLTRSLKDDPNTSSIPIIIITAFAMKHDEVKILASGCNTHIFKPISIDIFFSTLEKYLPIL